MGCQQKTLINPDGEEFLKLFSSFGENLNSNEIASFQSTFDQARLSQKPLTRLERRNGIFFGLYFTQTCVLVFISTDEKEVKKMITPVKNKQSGFSLVESIVALMIGIIIVVIASALILTRAKTVENVTATTNAENAAEEALSALTAKVSDLSVSSSFTTISENTIELSSCSATTCDFVLEPDADASQKTSLAGGVPFSVGFNPPTGSHIAFVRRWRVTETNTDYKIRQVGIAVLPSLESTSPIILEKSDVALSQ